MGAVHGWYACAARGRRALLRTCFGIKPSELRSVRPEQSGTFCGNGFFPFEPTKLACLCCLSSNVVCRGPIFAMETLIGAMSNHNYRSCSSASNCFSRLRAPACTCRGDDETAAKFVSCSFQQNKLGKVGETGLWFVKKKGPFWGSWTYVWSDPVSIVAQEHGLVSVLHQTSPGLETKPAGCYWPRHSSWKLLSKKKN